MNSTLKSFILDSLAIILGIFITFAFQEWIDRAHDRKEVRSALWLVRTEILTNLEDVNTLTEYLKQERASAQYLINHRNDLDSCPVDSVQYHSGMILAEVNASVSNDALEMLKSSSLFQKLGNSLLAMKIIRAYDSCNLIMEMVDDHITARNARFENSINENNVNKISTDGGIDIPEFIKTDYGLYSMRWLANQIIIEQTSDISDVNEALKSIDDYIRRH